MGATAGAVSIVEGRLPSRGNSAIDGAGRRYARASPLIVLCFGLLGSPTPGLAADAEDSFSDADLFEIYCADYYRLEQCDDALLFIRKSLGYRYLSSLNSNDDPQAYLASLREVVEGGQQMRSVQASAVPNPRRN
jgi:hypothetical protein